MSTSRTGSETGAEAKDPGPLDVLHVLNMSVDELRVELHKRNLAPASDSKPDLQAALLTVVVEQTKTAAAEGVKEEDEVFTERAVTSVEFQLHLKRMELEVDERKEKHKLELEADERKLSNAYNID